MSMPLPSERLSLHSPELVVGRVALLPSTRGSPMSVPLPSERSSSPLILKNVFSAPQSSAIGRSPVGRASLAPLTLEGHL